MKIKNKWVVQDFLQHMITIIEIITIITIITMITILAIITIITIITKYYNYWDKCSGGCFSGNGKVKLMNNKS